MTQAPTEPEAIDASNIQGNLIGFNKHHQRFVFLQFPDAAKGKAFLGDLEPQVARGSEVRDFNALFKSVHQRGGAEGTVESAWTNIGLSASGLQALGATGLDQFPDEFRQGMAARASEIGDNDDSAPPSWVSPFNQAASIHAVVILAADEIPDLEDCYVVLQSKLQAHGVAELGHIDGNSRPGDNRGHEHFGFKDGISQPGIAGLTESSKVGQDQIAAGEFLIGHLDQDGNVSGRPVATPPQPGQPGYPPSGPPPDRPGFPDWATDGSFLVLRRLRQNVRGFSDFVTQQATPLGLSPEQLGAKLVGRWKSGAPLERTHDQSPDFDPTAKDPAPDDPSILSDEKINNFEYEPQDPEGLLVPRAAHIRKANPRNQTVPGKEESNRHRILRRGIPYGPEFQPTEQPYPGAGAPPDDQDRGLIFVCYQSSIARGFEFIQKTWANNPSFPGDGDGRDPIISQDVTNPEFRLPPRDAHLVTQRWVITTGGEYFFAPSISALRTLAAGT